MRGANHAESSSLQDMRLLRTVLALNVFEAWRDDEIKSARQLAEEMGADGELVGMPLTMSIVTLSAEFFHGKSNTRVCSENRHGIQHESCGLSWVLAYSKSVQRTFMHTPLCLEP